VVGLVPVVIVVGVIVFLLFGVLALLARFYRQVDQGRALVINTMRSEPVVAFTGAIVYPVINRAEVMDLSVKTVDIDRRGKEGLICNDNIRADINVTFFIRVNKTADDVLKVAQSIGCQRASDANALSELFTAKFAEALKTVGKHFNFEELYTKRDAFKDKIIEVIGRDLNGFILDDAAIDYLEQTPLEHLDKDNIMDADGIRKITDLTVIQNLKTNELRQKERMETGSQNLNADEAVFRFEQRRSEAEAKKNKEVSVAQSREQNEALRVASDEHKKTVLITTKNEEEAQIAEQNKERGVAIAQKAREREIAVESERVEKARALEAIGRERCGRIGRDLNVGPDMTKCALGRPEIARPIVEHHDLGPPGRTHPGGTHRTPLVLGMPLARGSGVRAARSARAKALNWASTMWCGLRPYSTRRCTQMPADAASDSKKCAVSVVS